MRNETKKQTPEGIMAGLAALRAVATRWNALSPEERKELYARAMRNYDSRNLEQEVPDVVLGQKEESSGEVL